MSQESKIGFWGWIVIFLLFFAGTQLSLLSKIMTGSALFYFPLPLALVLTYWLGPRVLIPFYLNAILCCQFWGLEKTLLWPVYAFPEALFVGLSWLGFIKINRGKPWLPDITELVYFLILGIVAPLVIYKFLLESIFFLSGDSPKEKFWHLLIATSFGDFISIFAIATPLLFFLSPTARKIGLLHTDEEMLRPITRSQFKSMRPVFEIAGLTLLAALFSLVLSFEDYWFIYGILSLLTAIRFGFGLTLLYNSIILLLTYMIPAVVDDDFSRRIIDAEQILTIQLGTALLYVFSAITARVITDMHQTRKNLRKQNSEMERVNTALTRANTELDRFVYSASHDLSAPLKTISGLINLSRMANDDSQRANYLDLIQKSVRKLEGFIHEIQDYSLSTRSELNVERVDIKTLCDEIAHEVILGADVNGISIDLTEVEGFHLDTDKTRLRIILFNLFSNAVAFRKKLSEVPAFIKVVANGGTNPEITISDNGEGIRDDFKDKIFKMFFRGSENSKGAGLGLYVANEAAAKIGAVISFTSAYDQGSTFKVTFPNYRDSSSKR